MIMLQTISIYVSGKVQGVFYRQSTREKAISLGITGTVRNLPDKRVHIIATGTPFQLNQLQEWCKTGPPKAIVSCIEANEIPLEEFEKFSIAR